MLNLKNSKQIEKAVLLKIINNAELHERYIPNLLTGTFGEPEHRMIAFAMKRLYEKKVNITAKNVLLFISKEPEAHAFARKYSYDFPDLNIFEQIITFELETKENTTELFEDFYKLHLELAFRRFVDKRLKSMRQLNDYKLTGAYYIAEEAKSIIQLYDKFYHNQAETIKDGIRSSATFINTGGNFIPTWSSNINSIMYGWSRGYPNSVLARSGHGKSTYLTNEIRHKLRKNIVNKVAVISSEEEEPAFWQRMFALECGISLEGMHQGLVRIADSQIDKIESLYKDRLFFIHEISYNKIIQIMHSLADVEFIIFDHLNAIDYPGGGNALQNMPGGIAKLVTHQKKFLEVNPKTTIINVNQVKEKDLPHIRSHWKCPSYEMAYGSSTTYFAARQWLTLYYPYNDMVNRPHEWLKAKVKPDIFDLYFEVQKSSFSSEIGKGKLYWAGDLALMEDAKKKPTTEFTAPQEDMDFDKILRDLEKKN